VIEILYGRYAIGDCCKLIIFKFLHSAVPTRRLLEVVRWNVDAIAHDPLRMHISNLTKPNLTWPKPFTSDVCLHAFHNKRMAGRELMKFGVDVMP
jgi:hypothetical protein